jgi:ATP-dependent Lon protease
VSEVLKHALIAEPVPVEWDEEAEEEAAAARALAKGEDGAGAIAH